MIRETVFEKGFMDVEELGGMNGDMKIEGGCVMIKGGVELEGGEVGGSDLGGGGGVIVGGLVGEGDRGVSELKDLERG